MHCISESTGRSRRLSLPPAISAAISIAALASCDVVNALGLHVLGGVFPNGFDLVQAARFAGVSCAETGTQWNATSSVASATRDNVAYVLQTRGALLTGLDVDHFHAAAVRAEVDVISVQLQILLRVARRELIGRRTLS